MGKCKLHVSFPSERKLVVGRNEWMCVKESVLAQPRPIHKEQRRFEKGAAVQPNLWDGHTHKYREKNTVRTKNDIHACHSARLFEK